LFNASHNLLEVAGHWRDCQLPATSFEAKSCWALRTGGIRTWFLRSTTPRRGNHAAGVDSSYLWVPILAQGEALGILHIQATDQDPNLGEAGIVLQHHVRRASRAFAGEHSPPRSLARPVHERPADRLIQSTLFAGNARARNPPRHPCRTGARYPDARSGSLQELQRHLRTRSRRCRFARNRIIPHAQHSC